MDVRCWMLSMEAGYLEVVPAVFWGCTASRTCSTRSSVSGCWVSEANARERINALSRERTLDVDRLASRSRTPIRASFVGVWAATLAEYGELQRRVGGAMSTSNPLSNLSFSRLCRSGIDAGARSAESTSCALLLMIESTRVEELLGGLVLTFQELNVFQQQDVDFSIASLESGQVGALEGGHEVAGERLCGGIADLEAPDAQRHVVADGLDRWVLPNPAPPQMNSGL